MMTVRPSGRSDDGRLVTTMSEQLTTLERAERVTAWTLATWFGCGRVPVAPGTAGAIGAIPLHLVLRWTPAPVHALAILGITGVGIWSGQKVSEYLDKKDPQVVVIDEVVGTLIAMGMVRKRGPLTQALAFVLFRAFDMTKPGPVGKAEAMKPPGVGIMMDDVVAGFMAGAAARLFGRG